MALTRINNNVSALTATRNLNSTSHELAKTLERLSSGLRINRASDDAAGLSISEIQRTQIRGLNRALQNAQDAISLVNTAEGALAETTSRLQRMRELAVQAANSAVNDAAALQAIQDEIDQSIDEINRIGQVTQYSTRKLLNGDNQNQVSVAMGSRDRGVSVARTTGASTLASGLHFLEIQRAVVGSAFLDTTLDPDFQNNSGITAGSITGSTFASGLYDLVISNFQAESARVLRSASFEPTGANTQVDGSTLLTQLRYMGRELVVGDAITISGVDENGAAVAGGVIVTAALTMNLFAAAINDVYDDGALDATASISGGGLPGAAAFVELTNSAVGAGQTSMTLAVTPAAGATLINTAAVVNAGNLNTAAARIGGGPAVQVISGETVTLYGRAPGTLSQDERPAQMTITFGALANGVDILRVTADEYAGRLDNGSEIRFRNGEREVMFRGGSASGFESGEFVVLNFDATLAVPPGVGSGTAVTVIFSAVNRGLNFQIGANAGQSVRVDLNDLQASALGFADGVFDNITRETSPGTVDTIDVRSVSGAMRALSIIDRAISQVNRQRSFLGAITNRLEGTISNLGIAVENLTAAESRIRDADIAHETTQFTKNQVLVQAGTAILAQANAAPQAVLQLLT